MIYLDLPFFWILNYKQNTLENLQSDSKTRSSKEICFWDKSKKGIDVNIPWNEPNLGFSFLRLLI